MLSVKLPRAAIRRERQRGSNRVVRRWWNSQPAAYLALKASGVEHGHVRQCDMGDQCPEHAHVVAVARAAALGL